MMKYKLKSAAVSAVASSVLMMPMSVGATSWSKATSDFNTMDKTYKAVENALNHGTKAQVEALFIQYSNEAVTYAGDDNGNSAVINSDITALAAVSNHWAWVGYTTITTHINNLGPWTTINAQLTAVLTKFMKDMKSVG